jgi:hypothetical protein
MIGAPRLEIPISRENAFNELIHHVLRRLADELCVRKKRLVVLAVQTRDVANEVLLRRARFDGWHVVLQSVDLSEHSGARRAPEHERKLGGLSQAQPLVSRCAERAGATPERV